MTRDAGTREGSRHNARRRKRRLALWSAVPAWRGSPWPPSF